IVLLDLASGHHESHKELTTPDEPEVGVMSGIQRLLARQGIAPSQIVRVVHATTLFTNALIERKGARTGLITTQGFRDVLEIGRERRYDLYDNFLELIEPLAPRDLRREVSERMRPDGSIDRPLDLDQLERETDALVADGVESIAVAFLHSYRNPLHETQAVEHIQARHPGLSVTGSAEVAAEIREYERFSTAVTNAYVKPLAIRYISLLETRLEEAGIRAGMFLMQSNGGLVHTSEAKRLPIQLLESGPAAGALVAAHFGREVKEPKILAFDMGGTTAKMSVIDDGEPLVAYTFEAARQKRFRPGSGLPVRISTIELIEIGAGGGSIAHVDHLGLLKVGPLSAGSKPGPACYGKGGEKPTVTDANLLAGYLDAASFAGGTMTIDPELAREAVSDVAGPLTLGVAECVPGIIDVVNETMAAAARVHITERGGDARQYSLLVTGGGGPLHGYSLARKLRLKRMLCPPSAGVASALGLLIAPPKVTRVKTMSRQLASLDMNELEAAYQEIEREATQILAESGVDHSQLIVRRYADMRYVGQGFELVAELPAGPYGEDASGMILDTFGQVYLSVFSVKPPVEEAEIVNIRIAVTGKVDRQQFIGSAHSGSVSPAATEERRVRDAYCPDLGRWVSMPIYDRSELAEGRTYTGPLILEEPASTLIVGSHGNLLPLPNGVISIELIEGN
ncbi:MAG: hydantoinase/oxoprolinase family protein, partial [Pigmentiphaga sp.]